MTHEELLARLDYLAEDYYANMRALNALRAVVELHRRGLNEGENHCNECFSVYPCKTIQAIEKELG